MEVQNVLNILASKGYISEDIIPKILEEEDFKEKKRGNKKKTSEERRGVYDEKKCDARVWCEGYDNVQCNFKKIEGKCFCTKHQKCVERDGRWWLGLITEKRPENPEHKIGGIHKWKTDENGDEYEKVENEIKPVEKKRKRGRPKGSKNKNKKVPTKKEKKELSIEEIEKLLKQKKSEQKNEEGKKEEENSLNESEEENEIEYIVDGVKYEVNDDDILDPEDFSPIGKKDGSGGIIFEDDDARMKHLSNVENLK